MAKETVEKPMWLQMRLTDEDRMLLDELTEMYDLDRSNLIRKALRYIRENKPTFQIAPQERETPDTQAYALAGLTA